MNVGATPKYWTRRYLISGVCGLALCVGLIGCSSVKMVTNTTRYLPPGYLPYQQLSSGYHRVVLKRSSTLDVLQLIRATQMAVDANQVGRQLVSQSDTLVAASGRSKDLQKSWFSLFAFDQQDMTALRKYFFCLEEHTYRSPTQPTKYLFPPRRTLVFDSQIELPEEILQNNYPSRQVRDIALLRYLAATLRSDIRPMDGSSRASSNGNQILAVCGMFMNNVFRDALVQLDASPSLAADMGRTGMVFNQMLLNEGRIQMYVAANSDVLVTRVEMGVPLTPPRRTTIARN